MVHTPGSHLLTTNQTQIISKTRTHRSQQSILLQLFFATQVLHLRVRNLGLACKIGTFLGPNLDFGPIWDQVPNLGLHYSAWVQD